MEHEIRLSPEIARDPVGMVYACRLASLIDLRNHIDNGELPLNFYCSTMLTPEELREGNPAVSIYEDPKTRRGGLRFGILHAITFTIKALDEQGYKDIALDLVERGKPTQ